MTEDTSPSTGRLYVYVTGWERFQGRKDRPGQPWFRVYSDLASNDDWNELSNADRCLLMGLWMDTNTAGQGRVSGNIAALRGRHKCRRASLDSLVQAGFVTLSTTKGAPTGHQLGALEEKRGEEEKPLKVSPSSTASREDSSAGVEAPPPNPSSNGQLRKPSTTELDDDLRPLAPIDANLPRRDADGFLY